MPKTPRQTRKLSPFFLIPFTFFLTLLLSLPWVNAKEAPKPKPQPWQIEGIVAALNDSQDQVKGYAFDKLTEYKPQDLKLVVKKPEDIAQKAANILKDEKVNAYVRSSAAIALGNIRKLELEEVVVVLNNVYEPNQQSFEKWRFLTYFLSGGTDKVKTLLKWLGNPKALSPQLKYEEGKKTLEVFRDAWTGSEGLERLRTDF